MKVSFDGGHLECDFEIEEQEVVDWVVKTYGSSIFENHIKEFIRGRRAQMDATIKDDVYKAYKDHPEVKDIVHSKLGVK